VTREAVWAGSTTGAFVFRIDPRTNAFRRIRVGGTSPAWLGANDDAVWVADVRGGVVIRLDPTTGAVVARVEVGPQPVDGTVAADGSAWFPLRGADQLVRIDPETNTVVERVPVGTTPFVVNEAFGDLWVPSYGGADVRRVRP
jgi:streptogramin lyase